MGLRARHPRQVEAVTDLDALDRLDAHEGGGQPGVQTPVPVDVRAEAHGHAVRQHLDHAAEGVAVLVGLVDLGHHRLARVRVQAAHRVGVQLLHVGGLRVDPVRGLGRGQLDDVRDDLDAGRLLEEGTGDGPQGDPGGGLAGGGALQDRAGLVEAVLLHPGEVGVAGAGTGQRRVTGQRGQLLRVHRVGRHHLLPLGPLGVADHHRHRRAQRQAVPHSAQERDLVLLELHPGTAAVAEPAPGQGVRHHLRGDRDSGRKALQRRHECGAVRLPRRQPAQPAQRCSSCTAHPHTVFPRSSHVARDGRRPVQGADRAREDGRDGAGRTGRVSGRRAPPRRPCASRPAAPGTAPSSAPPGVRPGGPAGPGRRPRRRRGRPRRWPASSARARRGRRRACRAARERRRRARRWCPPGSWRWSAAPRRPRRRPPRRPCGP